MKDISHLKEKCYIMQKREQFATVSSLKIQVMVLSSNYYFLGLLTVQYFLFPCLGVIIIHCQ